MALVDIPSTAPFAGGEKAAVSNRQRLRNFVSCTSNQLKFPNFFWVKALGKVRYNISVFRETRKRLIQLISKLEHEDGCPRTYDWVINYLLDEHYKEKREGEKD